MHTSTKQHTYSLEQQIDFVRDAVLYFHFDCTSDTLCFCERTWSKQDGWGVFGVCSDDVSGLSILASEMSCLKRRPYRFLTLLGLLGAGLSVLFMSLELPLRAPSRLLKLVDSRCNRLLAGGEGESLDGCLLRVHCWISGVTSAFSLYWTLCTID